MSSRMQFSRFAPPAFRVELLPRHALKERLDQILARPLTVVAAPAGYGKTSLLAQWRSSQLLAGARIAWLSVLEDDLDGGQLLSDVVLAITRAGTHLGQLSSLAEQGFTDVSTDAIVGKLAAHFLEDDQPMVLIIDDTHRITPKVFKRIIGQITIALPAQLHLVLSGRDRPPINLLDLQSRGLLLQLSARELCFTETEAKALLSATLPAQVQRLMRLTEGWPAALQLSRAWLEAHPERAHLLDRLSGSVAQMADYLTEQVLADLPSTSLNVLRDASILNSFNADLVAAVTGSADAWSAILDSRKLDYLLVPLDEERYWFRYHNLLAEYLSDRLNRMPSHYVLQLHARASDWFEAHDMLLEAVRHAGCEGNYSRAAALIEKKGVWEMVYFGGFTSLRQLLQAIPAERMREFPRLQLGKALLLAKEGDVRGAYQLYTAASEATGGFTRGTAEQCSATRRDARIVWELVAGYSDQPRKPEALDAIYSTLEELHPDDDLARAALLNVACVTALALGDMQAALDACQRAVRAMRHVGSVLGLNYCYLHLGLAHLHFGARREAEATFREALALAEENFGADSGLRACAELMLAVALHARGELTEARLHLDRSLGQVESFDSWLDLYAEGYDAAAAIAFVKEGEAALTQIISRMRATALARGLDRLTGLAQAIAARFEVLNGRLDEADAALAQVRPVYEIGRWQRDPFSWRVHHAAGLAAAMLALSREDLDTTTTILTDLADAARVMHRHSDLAPVRMLEALTKFRRHETEDAHRLLVQVLEDRVAEDDVQELANLGPLILPLLQAARSWAADRWPSMRGRKALAALTAAADQWSPGAVSGAIALSPREFEVLEELARGASNKVIARTLQMTENTVKFHLKNIFQKLNVRHRADAIRAIRLNSVIHRDLPDG